jgi:hypothetical protein
MLNSGWPTTHTPMGGCAASHIYGATTLGTPCGGPPRPFGGGARVPGGGQATH